jgi:hypothetical protein
MAEIRGRGRILAAQLFLSTMEIALLIAAKKSSAQKKSRKCTSHKTRMDEGFFCIDFHKSL